MDSARWKEIIETAAATAIDECGEAPTVQAVAKRARNGSAKSWRTKAMQPERAMSNIRKIGEVFGLEVYVDPKLRPHEARMVTTTVDRLTGETIIKDNVAIKSLANEGDGEEAAHP